MITEKHQLKEFIFSLCSQMSVSGFEERAGAYLREIARDGFDGFESDAVGNHIFIKRCGRADAPRILIDTHFDEIGFLVSDICEGGFLRISAVGGVDAAILQASEVIVYGKERIRGVISSTPPHLKKDESGELTGIEDLLVDTGYSAETLKTLVNIGTPVGFADGFDTLISDRIIGRSFDNKACGAIAISALKSIPESELAGDVYLLFSSYEETSRIGGAVSAASYLRPDYAMVIDVNLARVPDTKKGETVEIGKGISISVSAATSVELSERVMALCDQRGIAYTAVAAPSSTGTNAVGINLAAEGIPTVDVGLPLINMHTYSEIISLDDAASLSALVRTLACDRGIAEDFSRRAEEKWKTVN